MSDPRASLKAEAKSLLAKITPGPWAWESIAEKSNEFAVGTACLEGGTPIEGRIPEGEWVEDAVIRGTCIGMNESGHANFADAEFIAAAPRLVRELLTLLDAAPAQGWQEELQRIPTADFHQVYDDVGDICKRARRIGEFVDRLANLIPDPPKPLCQTCGKATTNFDEQGPLCFDCHVVKASLPAPPGSPTTEAQSSETKNV